MSLKRRLSKNWVAGIAGALLSVTVGFVLHQYTAGSGIINLSYDLLTVAKPVTIPTNAVLVFMDEASHEKLGQPLNAPWDRALHAQLVDKLTAAGVKAIVFDIVFSDPMPGKPEADQEFARAIAASKRVVLAADHERLADNQSRFKMPIDDLRNVAAGVGSAEVLPSRDLIVRSHTPREQLPSLGEAVAEFVSPSASWPPERWLYYYGPANTLPSLSYAEALTESAAIVRDKVVFVGARIMTRFAGERKD